jgi:hypothetical protein
MSEVEVRRVTEGNDKGLTYLVKMHMDVKQQTEEQGFDGYSDDNTFLNSVVEVITKAAGSEDDLLLVAVCDGKYVGGLVAELHKTLPMYRHRLLAMLKLIYVEEEYRETDIVIKLGMAFDDWAEEIGADAKGGMIYHNNPHPMGAVLEKYGYKRWFTHVIKEV